MRTSSEGTLFFYDEEGQEFEVDIEFDYYYDPGRQYMPNGDPGYPEEETVELVKVHRKDSLPSWITDDVIYDKFEEDLPELVDYIYAKKEADYEDSFEY